MCRELIWINKRCLFYLKALTVNYHDMCLQRVSLCESSHLNSLFMSLLTLLKQAWYHTVYNSSAVRSPIVQMINVNVLINVLCMSGWSVNQDESVRREWLSGSPLAPHNLSIFPALFFSFSGSQTTYFFIRWFYGILEYSGICLVKGSILQSNILVMSATVFKWLVPRKLFPTLQKHLKYCYHVQIFFFCICCTLNSSKLDIHTHLFIFCLFFDIHRPFWAIITHTVMENWVVGGSFVAK